MKHDGAHRWTQVRGVAADARAGAPIGSAEANCFYESALLDPAVRHFDTDGEVRLLDAMDDDGMPLARLPVAVSRRHGRFPVMHTVNWAYPHCYYGAPLLVAGREQEGWHAILAMLDAAEWSGSFLHLRLVDPEGPALVALRALCDAQGRKLHEVERYERAFLESASSADAYWTANVRAKKRKELRRQQNRLAECGAISRRALAPADDLTDWCDAFLMLEAMGWKGEGGTALAARPADAGFFREACAAAFARGGLDMLRIDRDGQPIAMLVNFVGPGGGFSFKIAIDPAFSRYSPGVLVEIDNLARILDEGRAPWMDSCAMPGHPMIDSLWAERRTITQYRIPLRKRGGAALQGALGRWTIEAGEALMRKVRP